ncbi:MAG: murein L,D-transpeptidase catalytic domain-containing protein [Planctomycetota bacterium]
MTTISSSVGKNCPDAKTKDVRTIATLINGHLQAGKLPGVDAIPMHVAGNDHRLIVAITKVQRDWLNFNNPDGRVDPGGKTFGALNGAGPEIPDSDAWYRVIAVVRGILHSSDPPPGHIPQDLWRLGLERMDHHMHRPRANRPDIIKPIAMFVDFRKSNGQKRLWLVDLRTRKIILETLVAHGKGYGSKDNIKFSNVKDSLDSSTGAYVVGSRTMCTAGSLGMVNGEKKSGPAAVVHGLESSNSRAKSRAILIHGASYVSRNWAGNSHGCFSTHPDDNAIIVNRLTNGGFIYAYAGEAYRNDGPY